MSEICGCFSMHPNCDPTAILGRMLGRQDVALAESAQPMHTAAIAADGDARLVQRGAVRVAFIGHPQIRLPRGWSTDVHEIATAIGRDGADALSLMGGDFALAAWDAERIRGLLATDRIGIRPIAYTCTAGAVAFASNLGMLARHPDVDRELSPQALFDYLYFHVCPGPETIYRNVYRVPPGHYVEFGTAGISGPRAYWTIRFEETERLDFAATTTRFVTLLQQAVARAASDATCGAFLSGGTDSSTVSGMLARVNGSRARTFSIGFDVAGYDEMDYARIAARHFACEHYEYYVTPQDVVAAAPRIASHYDQPFGNASAVPAYYCAKLAHDHGVRRLLAGDGGDELFGGNERYAKQWLLGLYDRLPRSIRSSLIEPLVLSTRLTDWLPMLRKLRSYVEQASPPMPDRYESRALLAHLRPENVLTADFLASIDPRHPQALLHEAHAPFAACSLINQMLGIDLRFTLADSDLPKVTRMCELAAVDVTFPLLDDEIVEFSAQLPANMKLRGTRLRWFFKEALRDFLPPEVIAKRKHGFGLPVGAWLISHRPLLDLASDATRILVDQRIVRADFIDDLRQRLLPAHPAYYGTMMWVLMMLGLWLQAKRV